MDTTEHSALTRKVSRSPITLGTRLIREELYLPEQLQPVPLQHDEVSSLADLDEALRRSGRQAL
jgi:hypothetical protein